MNLTTFVIHDSHLLHTAIGIVKAVNFTSACSVIMVRATIIYISFKQGGFFEDAT